MQSNLANYLPLTGGTVSGNVTINGNTTVGGIIATGNSRARQWYTTDTTNGYYYLTLGVDDWDVGSRIQMMTADSPHDPSVIAITSGTNQMQIRKDAFLAGGKNIVRSVNGTVAGTDGNVALPLATVATSGNYNDLSNRPSIPSTPKAYVTQTWTSGTSWYRKYSDGWIEQGGLVSGISVSVYRWGTNTYALTLPTAFASTNYHVSASGNNDYIDAFCYKKETTTATITFKANEYNSYQTTVCSWYACGY